MALIQNRNEVYQSFVQGLTCEHLCSDCLESLQYPAFEGLVDMIRCSIALVCLVGLPLFSATASAQNNRQRGATLGGLGGAAIGGIIGENNGEAGAGAAIGGLLGAVAGGIMGDAADKDAAVYNQRRYYQQQQFQYQQQQQIAAIQRSAVTTTDVISMSRSGVSDNLIINQINQRGFGRRLEVADIISLHQQGVSEHVISALQSAPAPSLPTAPARPAVPNVITHSPVVIERPVIVGQPVIEHVVPSPVIIHSRPPVRYTTPRTQHYRAGRPRNGSTFHFRF